MNDPLTICDRETYVTLAEINNPQLRYQMLNEMLKLANPHINCGGCSILDIIIEIGYYSVVPQLLNAGYYCIRPDNYPLTLSTTKLLVRSKRMNSVLNRIILTASTEIVTEILNIVSQGWENHEPVEVRKFLSHRAQLHLMMKSPFKVESLLLGKIIQLPLMAHPDSLNLEAIKMIGMHNPKLNIHIEYIGGWEVSIVKPSILAKPTHAVRIGKSWIRSVSTL